MSTEQDAGSLPIPGSPRAEVPPESVMSQLEAILASETFKNATRLGRFLRYVVEQSLNRNTVLKERDLGVEVFDRVQGYDTRADPVVRVEARQLRFKLAEYYANFGAADECLITLPKGGYAARFERRIAAVAEVSGSGAESGAQPANETLAEVEQRPTESDLEAEILPSKSRAKRAHWKWIRWGAVFAASALAVVLAYLGMRKPVLPGITARSSKRLARPAVNPEAQDLYLKGRYYWNKRTPGGLAEAVDYFTQAIVRDPGYAQAYVGLAESYNLLSEFTSIPPREAFAKASAAAKRAVELDSSSAEAHNALAFASFWGAWDMATAEREFQRALALNPNDAQAHHWYATYLLALGRISESLGEIQRAQELNPMSAPILADKGLILFHANRRDEAISSLKQLEATDPEFLSSHRYLRDIALVDKDYSTYAWEARQTANLSHDAGALAIAEAAQKGLRNGGGRAVLESVLQVEKRLHARGLVEAYSLAEIYALAGQKQAAFEYLEDSFDQHEDAILAVRIDFLLDSLNGDPRYEELLKKVGLPALRD